MSEAYSKPKKCLFKMCRMLFICVFMYYIIFVDIEQDVPYPSTIIIQPREPFNHLKFALWLPKRLKNYSLQKLSHRCQTLYPLFKFILFSKDNCLTGKKKVFRNFQSLMKYVKAKPKHLPFVRATLIMLDRPTTVCA